VSPRRLLAMARKEALQLSRDRRSLALAFLLPLLLLVLFGYAITWDIRQIETAVWDQDRSAASRRLLEAFEASGYFAFVAVLEEDRQVARLLDRGEALVVLVIPPGFSRRLGSGEVATVQALVDGSDANTATIALGYVQAVVQEQAQRLALDGRAVSLPLTPESRVWYNEELRSRNMIVPGLVAVIMTLIAAMLTSLTIAREWERGTMEQLAATPVTRLEVVLGKLLPYVVIGLVDVAIASLVGVFLFGVPFRGSIGLLAILSLFFLLGASGLGMAISAMARSQLLATQVALVASYLPALLLSGFMFAISAMPRPLQLLTYLVPARYFLEVTRGIFLKGVGVEVLRTQGLLMIAFAAAGVALATWRFRKELG
jgi:ABC-2 type transport system permease protein